MIVLNNCFGGCLEGNTERGVSWRPRMMLDYWAICSAVCLWVKDIVRQEDGLVAINGMEDWGCSLIREFLLIQDTD